MLVNFKTVSVQNCWQRCSLIIFSQQAIIPTKKDKILAHFLIYFVATLWATHTQTIEQTKGMQFSKKKLYA